MDFSILKELIDNAALLLSLSIIYELRYFMPKRLEKFTPVINGLLIGFIGIVTMAMPLTLFNGLVFDTRSILIGVTALIFGEIPVSIAAVMTMAYRVLEGGVGIRMGIPVILVCTVIGLLWRRAFLRKKLTNHLLHLYLFGVAIHLAMLGCAFFLPYPTSVNTLRDISWPVILVYPIATVLLGFLLIRQKERDDAVHQIVEAEGRYKSLFDNNHAVMLLIEPITGQIIDANPAACKFYGWPIETMREMNISQVNTLTSEEIKAEMANSLAEKRNHFLFKHRRAFGAPVDVEVYSGPIKLNSKEVLYSIVHDISERAAADKAKQQSELRFQMLVEGAPDAIYIQTNKRFAFANKAALLLYGAVCAEDLLDTPVMDRIHSDYHQVVTERIGAIKTEKKNVSPLEQRHIRLDGVIVYVDVTAVPINYNGEDGALVFVRDISERKRLEQENNEMEAQLRQNQKLEAIGTLAGGVAHEINNPINGIMNYAQLILDDLDSEDSNAGYATEIIRESERISGIVKNLLQFSRQEKQSHSYASIEDIINQTISLLKTIIKKDNITLNIDFEKDLPDIKCRSQQIQQVLMNLLTNARDALNEKYPGDHKDKIINVSCSQYTKDDRRWIRIVVEDHGNGISDTLKEKIYEPFFSTKPKDKGTGLGLSISFGIVKDHHGTLDVESQKGSYTRFVLNLPVDNGWSLQ